MEQEEKFAEEGQKWKLAFRRNEEEKEDATEDQNTVESMNHFVDPIHPSSLSSSFRNCRVLHQAKTKEMGICEMLDDFDAA